MKSMSKHLRQRIAEWLLKDIHINEAKFGKNSITVDPGGVDVIRWSGTQAAIAAGDIGMNVVSGRPQAFVGGINQSAAMLGDIGIQSIANVAAAPAADQGVAITQSGTLIFVQTLQRWFAMDPTSGAAVDGLTVLTASGGSRRWVWVAEMQNGHWATVWAGQTVSIDPVAGNDENDGVALALKTIAEASRRLRRVTLMGALTITFASQPAVGADGPSWVGTVLNGFVVTVNMPRAVVRSSTLTAATAVQNSAAANGGTATVLADTSLANWNADINSLFRDTGANNNVCCWVMKDTGGGGITARGSVTRTTASPGSTGAPSTIASGDTYNIENPGPLNMGAHDFGLSTAGGSVTYNDVDLQSGLGFLAFFSVRGGGIAVLFNRCRANGTTRAIPRGLGGCQIFCQQCLFVATPPSNLDAAQSLFLTGCALTANGGSLGAGFYRIQGDSYAQAGSNLVGWGWTSIFQSISLGGCAGFDAGANFAQFESGRGVIVNSIGLQWGNSSAGSVGWFHLSAPPVLLITNVPSVTGNTPGVLDFKLSTGIQTFRQWVEANASYGPALTSTWANVTAQVFPGAIDIRSGSGFMSSG